MSNDNSNNNNKEALPMFQMSNLVRSTDVHVHVHVHERH